MLGWAEISKDLFHGPTDPTRFHVASTPTSAWWVIRVSGYLLSLSRYKGTTGELLDVVLWRLLHPQR